jgi:hypothetical protein
MIELPQDFLNLLFALLIVLAGLNRSRQRSGRNGMLAPQSIALRG